MPDHHSDEEVSRQIFAFSCATAYQRVAHFSAIIFLAGLRYIKAPAGQFDMNVD
jgi:hypothetical protein